MKAQRMLKLVILGTIVTLSLSVGLSRPALAGEKILIRAGHQLPPTHPYQLGLEYLAKILKERSKERIELQVSHSAQLGTEPRLFESVKTGSVDMAIVATTNMASAVPELQVLDLPFTIRDTDHLHRVVDGSVGKNLAETVLRKTGVRILGYWDSGVRGVYSTKPIRNYQEAQGSRLRVMTVPTYITAFEAIGTIPTTVEFVEVYSALKQGVIDGAEGSIVAYYQSKHYESAKYLALTKHASLAVCLIMNDKLFQSLSPDLQKVVLETSAEATAYERKKFDELEKDVLDKLKAHGVTVSEIDTRPFTAAVRPTYTQFESIVGKENLQRVLESK